MEVEADQVPHLLPLDVDHTHHATPRDLPGHVAAWDDDRLADDVAGYLIAHLQFVHRHRLTFPVHPVSGRGAGFSAVPPRRSCRHTFAVEQNKWPGGLLRADIA